MIAQQQKISPPELARRWGVRHAKILSLIHAGELRAIDSAIRKGQRPRYLIDLADIADFERRREVSAPAESGQSREAVPS